MIRGVVSGKEIRVRLYVHGSGAIRHEVEAILDTGFNGYITLPQSLIDILSLSYLYDDQTELGDGSMIASCVYEGVVLWDGHDRNVDVQASEGDILVGMTLLRGYRVCFDAIPDGPVTIEAIPMPPIGQNNP